MQQTLTIMPIITGGDARRFKKWVGLIFSVICLFVGTPLLAQFDSAQINGTVRDQSGAAIPNATVQIQNRDTGLVRQTLSNGTGAYILSEIPPGVYKITARMAGFSTASREGVELTVSQNSTFDFALKPGATTETVEVSAQSVQLDTSSTSVGANLESESVNDLPLNGRNYSGLLVMQPGVTPINNDQTGGRTNPVGNPVYPSIQGQNNRSNVYLLDGVNNNEAISGSQTITPVPDDIQEVRLVTHTDSALFGEGLGGTINVLTKAGTNQFHGAAWEFWRSSDFFDATSDPSGLLQNLHQNQFGGGAGGPVLLPRYNGKNRTFFYGSYEGFRQSIGSVTDQLVPTANELAGNFSALATQLYNPYSPTRAAFVGNDISAHLDPNMVALAKKLFPNPSGSYEGGVNNYRNTTPATQNSDQYDIRGDEYLGKRDLVWAHYLHQTDPVSVYGGIPGLSSVTGYVGHNFGAQWIHTFGPSSVLTVAFGQNIGQREPTVVYSGDVQSIVTAAGFATSYACSYNFGLRSGCMLPQVAIGSYMGGGENNQSPNVNSDVWEYKADYQRTFGRHTLYVGSNIDTNNQGEATSTYSSLTFSPFQTSNGSTGGDPLASFLLGLPSVATRLDNRNTERSGYVDGFYGQDQWKIRDNLTINVGLRYDISFVPIVSNVKLGAYNDLLDYSTGEDVIQKLPPACSATQFAPCLPGGVLPAHVVVSSKPGQLYFPDLTNIQPRLGLSWGIRPNTVLHAGYGRVYDNWAGVEQSGQNTGGWLMETTQQAAGLNPLGAPTSTTAENPLAGFGGNYPPPTPFTSATWNTAPQFRNAYSDQWTFGIQQQVRGAGVWAVNYVGSLGRKLDYCPVANTAETPGPGAIAPRTPYPYMTQSFFDQPIGQLDYNALQTTFQGRNHASGLTYLISYTWSKGLNYGTDGWYGIGTTSIQNAYDFKADRSVTGYDLPQVFTAGWTWAVPVGKNGFSTGNQISDYVLGNWQINGIATLESGRPFTVGMAGDIANTGCFSYTGQGGAGCERPNQVGNPKPQTRTTKEWFNPLAFAAPAQYTFGNTPRNSLRTDPFKNLDLSIFREFPLMEAMKFQIRLDAFNSFNHPVWGVPNACVDCGPSFGAVTSTINNARQLQLSGKFVF